MQFGVHPVAVDLTLAVAFTLSRRPYIDTDKEVETVL
jgi:hypothetical protein